MQHAIILGMLVIGPTQPMQTAPAETVRAETVLAEDGPNDMLMNPSRHTEGAARLGGTEIVNPPHESFGMMQKPTGPSTQDIRQAPTGAPTVSGAEAKANAAEVHQQQKAAAEESGQAVRNPIPVATPEQIAADAANAQAAGVQAAVSSAATSRAASEAPPADQSPAPSTAPVVPDHGPDQSGPPDASPPTSPTPAAPEPVDPPDR